MTALRVNPLWEPETEVVLLPERAVYWPHAKTVLVADVHLGKCEAIRVEGGPMPDSILRADLERLGAVLARTEAARLVVLGDLLHAAAGVTPWLIDEVAAWRCRAAPATEVVLVPGNHDTRIPAVASAWGLRVERDFAEPPFGFCHHPCEREGLYMWAGHIHPLASLRSRRDELLLPAFWLGARTAVLPAFSAFTGGVPIRPAPGERLFAAVEDRVIEVPPA
jgi:DNA ligase-associated metallophosphoesterase